MKNITIVVAMDRDRVIGKDGQIPWRLRDDMEHFRRTTIGGVVVMGRKTYESLPSNFKPLPQRENIILTRDRSFSAPGCALVYDPKVILGIAENREVFVIGGAEIYKLFLPVSNKLIVTHVVTNVAGDVFFPVINGEWGSRIVSVHDANTRNQFPFRVMEYTRQ